jgi:hypothetical protein
MTKYATVQELKDHVDPNEETTWTDQDDANLGLALDAATEWIEERTGLNFAALTGTKYYTADDNNLLFIDDLINLTTLKTDNDADGVYETTWGSDDYILEPVNDTPKRLIRANPNTGDYYFPDGVANGVEVVGKFGTTNPGSMPKRVKAACLLIAHRLWKRHRVLFGIAGTGSLGVMVIKARITEDDDVIALLELNDLRSPY